VRVDQPEAPVADKAKDDRLQGEEPKLLPRWLLYVAATAGFAGLLMITAAAVTRLVTEPYYTALHFLPRLCMKFAC